MCAWVLRAAVAAAVGAGCGADGDSGTTPSACAPQEVGDRRVALDYTASTGDAGNGSSSSWPANPVSFPIMVQLDVGAVASAGNSENPVSVTQASLRVQDSSVCSLTNGPSCADGRCTFDLVATGYGICMVRVDVSLEDGTQLGTCWYKATFQNVATMDSDRTAVDGALSRCQRCTL